YYRPQFRNLRSTFKLNSGSIIDNDGTIFNVKNLPPIFCGGKSSFLILGSNQLKNLTDIEIEALDSNNNVIPYLLSSYIDSTGVKISLNITEDLTPGKGTLTLLGQLENNNYVYYFIDIIINPFKINVNEIELYNSPTVTIEESIKLFNSYPSSSYELKSGSIPSECALYNTNYGYVLDTLANPMFDNSVLYKSIRIDNYSLNASKSYYVTQSYNSNIEKVINDSKLILSDSLKAYNKISNKYEILNASVNVNECIMYYQSFEDSSITLQSESYAKIHIDNLNTFSGKIDSIKVFKNNINSKSNWELLGEYKVEPTNLLNVETDATDTDAGYIINRSIIETYWTATPYDSEDTPLIYHDRTNLLNSMDLSECTSCLVKPNFNVNLIDTTEYTIEFDYYIKGSGSFDVYMSGSALNHDNYKGQLINSYSSNSNKLILTEKINFIVDNTGNATITFDILSGTIYIGNIKIYTSYDINTNPSDVTLFVPIQPKRRNTGYEFKLIYLNPANVPCAEESYIKSPVLFSGENSYIDGIGNILSGSLMIGNTLSSGIEMAGTNSGFIRSVGYDGFNEATLYNKPGFLLYSGSVLPDSTNNYSGVGLELHGGGNSGSLRYKASNGQSFLEITGSIYAENGYFSGLLSAQTGSIANFYIKENSIESKVNTNQYRFILS
ncbi:MAG TPA: hypothetical protein PLY35_09055, partial [Thermotogota bacterium]|nr:hypothetical protein [Thermotogota bacterium]